MKKLLLFFGVLAFTFTSCNDKKKDNIKKETEPVKVEETQEAVHKTSDTEVNDDLIALGTKLFTEKTCTTCHALDTKLVGPAIQDIAKIYNDKKGNIVQFLEGNSGPIVDTDPGMVAIMKANLDSFVKDLTTDELQALSAYISSTVK
jgi:cytochrome c